MTERFDDETLALLDRTEEIDLEADGGHRTTIWIMVEDGQVYVRSVRGPEGRWYREIVKAGRGTLHVRSRGIPIRAVAASDDDSVEACNQALRRKYTGIPGFEPMFREHTLPTTLRLTPA